MAFGDAVWGWGWGVGGGRGVGGGVVGGFWSSETPDASGLITCCFYSVQCVFVLFLDTSSSLFSSDANAFFESEMIYCTIVN